MKLWEWVEEMEEKEREWKRSNEGEEIKEKIKEAKKEGLKM